MKGLRFAILPGGIGSNDAACNFNGYHFATADTKTRGEGWMDFPMPYFVIQHPTAGYIMYDVGCRSDADFGRPAEYLALNPSVHSRDEFADEGLKKMGLSVDDISAIIISHCHYDHIGGLEFFKGTRAAKNVYVGKADFAHALLVTHQSSKGYTDSSCRRCELDVDTVDYHFVEDDVELFPGVHLFILPGHTPGVLALMLELESGNYIFPNDAFAAERNYREPVVRPGGWMYDTLGCIASHKKLQKLEKQYNATLIFQHDPWLFPTYPHFQWIE